MATPRHNYTLSKYAYDGLLTLSHKQPARSTLNRRTPQPVYNGATVDYHIDTNLDTQRYEGLSHALIQIARNYDFSQWTPAPTTSPNQAPSYYTRYDAAYMHEAEQDDTPWDELSVGEQQDRQREISLLRRKPTRRDKWIARRYGLCLPTDIRNYYSNLLAFYNIPLVPDTTHIRSLTTRVSCCLEAIGSKHLQPPAGYQIVTNEPNLRKNKLAATGRSREPRKYGNHSHEPWMPKTHRRLPRSLQEYTQADVDYCCDNHLQDLAEEAVQLNPELCLPSHIQPVRRDEITASTHSHTKYAITSNDQLVLARAYHREHVAILDTQQPYFYRDRNITGAVLEALDYSPVPQSLADEWKIPLYLLRRLATKERIRRQYATPATATAPAQPSQVPQHEKDNNDLLADDEMMQQLYENCKMLLYMHNQEHQYKLPELDKFTQDDVHYCNTTYLGHFARVAVWLNPNLSMEDTSATTR